ncbi:MAG: RNA 2',3'-cyclic phosphodiesterase [Bacteroidales bacterium]|nr:RNA 2',3'-cyclic phosphodiesterase [Bacteroidales bacterium]
MKRTFIALDIPANQMIKKCLNVLSTKLAGEKINWMVSDNLHLTLKFLGDTEEKTITGIDTKLGEITKKIKAFQVIIKNVGIFKSIRDPRIIWLGIEADSELEELKKSIENQVALFGFQPEERKFSPHLTVGRIKLIKNKSTLPQLIESFQGQFLQQFTVPEIIFYESILKKEGPVYIPLGRYKLMNL